MDSYSEIFPWISEEDIPYSPKLKYKLFEHIKNLEIRKIIIMMSVRFRFVNNIKWKLIEDIKEIYNLCSEFNIEPIFSFLPYNGSNSYSTNIVIPRTTEAFYEFIKIADKIHPDVFYPKISRFSSVFEKNREDFLVGAWTYNHKYFPAANRPFSSKKLFGKYYSKNEEYHGLSPMSWEWSIKKYDFLVIKNDFNRPYSSFDNDLEFYFRCSEIGFPLILTFDLFECKYDGKTNNVTFKTFEKLVSEISYGGKGFFNYTLRKCPDELFSQIEKIDINYILDCFD